MFPEYGSSHFIHRSPELASLPRHCPPCRQEQEARQEFFALVQTEGGAGKEMDDSSEGSPQEGRGKKARVAESREGTITKEGMGTEQEGEPSGRFQTKAVSASFLILLT